MGIWLYKNLATVFFLLCCFSSLSFAQKVRITNLDDMALEDIDRFQGRTKTVVDTVCAYERNDNDNKYWIVADDGDINGEFEITHVTTGQKIPVRVRFQQENGRWKRLIEGRAKAFVGTSNRQFCNSGDNAAIEVRATRRNTQAQPAGDYFIKLNITMHAKRP